MTPEQFCQLKQGDIVRGKLSGESYVVTANYGDYVIAVRTAHLAQPSEWDLISPGGRSAPDIQPLRSE